MPIGRFKSQEELFTVAKEQANRQRKSDHTKSSYGRPMVHFRKKSDMCLAYSISDDYFYIGYSAVAGGIIGGTGDRKKPFENRADPDQPKRRFFRAKRTIKARDILHFGPSERRPIANCAEVCALSIAISWGQPVQNLIFITFYPETDELDRPHRKPNELKSPCGNCRDWLSSSFGYYMDGNLIINPR